MSTHIRHINFLMILRVLGWLLLIESVFMLAPLALCWIYGEDDFTAFAISFGITLVSGVLLSSLLRPKRTDMGRYEGFLLTASVWMVFSLFGMLPFIFGTAAMNVSSAYFEAMSGFTTTGCSAAESVENMSHGILLWRCLMQWIGGMGIILFTLAVLPMLNYSGGMQLFNAEVTGITHEKLRPRISATAKSLWMIYIVLTVALTLLLWAGPMNLFDSICHAFSTISTGGYSTHDISAEYFHSDYVAIVLMVFMFLGGTSFGLMYKFISGDHRAFWKNNVFRFYVYAVLLFYVLFCLDIFIHGNYVDWRSVTIYPLFQVLSTITSTGLFICDFHGWGPVVVALMLIMMFMGACAGSTSGGAKLDRIILLLKNCRNELYKCVHPNAVTCVRINDATVPAPAVAKVIAFLCIYVLVIIAGTVLLAAMGVPVADCLFSTFSCVCNTGFTTDLTGYGDNMTIIPDAGKWILSLLMLIGRLEIFTVLIIFTPDFWVK